MITGVLRSGDAIESDKKERCRALAVEARALAIRVHETAVQVTAAWLDSLGASEEQARELLKTLEAEARERANKL